MRISLSVRGGIYGTVRLKPIDTDADDVSVPEDVLGFIQSGRLERYEETAAGALASERSGLRTEQETYLLTVSAAGGQEKHFTFPKSAAEADSELKRLVDFAWSSSRPAAEP
jgi:hypothetical protein